MSGKYLEPVARDFDRKPKNFATADIEAMRWTQFLCVGYFTRNTDKKTGAVSDVYEEFLRLDEFIEYCFSKEQTKKDIFVHFGGIYDFMFFIKEIAKNPNYKIGDMIPRGALILSKEVFLLKKVRSPGKKKVFGKTEDGMYLVSARKIVFRDSSGLFNFSLSELTKNFGVAHAKKEMDHEKVTGVTPELLEYMKYDVVGLYESLEKFYEWPLIKAAGFANTIASQAVKIFQTFIKKPIPPLYGEIDAFARRSYFGGRTEIIKPMFMQTRDNESLNVYDVNSLYPYVMREYEYPDEFEKFTNKFHEDRFGIYDVDVYMPEMYIPPLGIKFSSEHFNKFIFPTGHFRYVGTSTELKYAMSLGARILKIHQGALFHSRGHLFREYIDTLYEMRVKSKKGSVDNVLCKLLMNSLYGRFGLNPARENLTFDYFSGEDLQEFGEITVGGGLPIKLFKKSVYLDKAFSNTAIASWVTSYARIHLHKLIQNAPEDMFNMDTDSLFTTAQYENNSEDLGALKFEYSVKNGFFLLPKTYLLEAKHPMFNQFDRKGKMIMDELGKDPLLSTKKIAMKGFSRRHISHFGMEDFYEAISGSLSRMRAKNPEGLCKFKTSVRKGEILQLAEESEKVIRSRYDKRRILRKNWSHEYDSEPLHIKDGKICNLGKSQVTDQMWKGIKKVASEVYEGTI